MRILLTHRLVVASLIMLGLVLTGAQHGARAEDPASVADRQLATDRAEAAAALARAQKAEELAQQAHETAKRVKDPVAKSVWEATAKDRDETARHLRQQSNDWGHKVDVDTAEAVRLHGGSEASTSAPAPTAPPKPPAVTGKSDAPMAEPSGTRASEPVLRTAVCKSGSAASDGPLALEDVLGRWDDDNGDSVDIQGDARKLVLKTTRQWEGTYDGGKLTFYYTPKETEISEAAPGWARGHVEGKLKWTIELKAHRQCGLSIIEGQWHPGALHYEEEKDAYGKVLKQSATVTGPGRPVELHYSRAAIISGAFVLDDQTGYTATGRPKWPYPFQKAALPYNLSAQPRTLFVYGLHLPRDIREIKSIIGEDPTVDYFFIAASKIVYDSP